MSIAYKSEIRVDAFDKVTGRTKYYEDLIPADALYVRIKHAEIAHGFVKKIDTEAAEKIPGVVKVLTCFDSRSRQPDIRGRWTRRIRTWRTDICSTSMSAIGAMTLPS